jgi:ankyrin repeat protein
MKCRVLEDRRNFVAGRTGRLAAGAGSRYRRVMRAWVFAAVALLMANISAQISADDRFHRAIRTNDLVALRGLIAAEGVDARDTLGQTPLMLASAFGSVEAVRELLAAGADARATSSSGATALHWAATNLEKTRALLRAGADINAVSQLGRSPLLVASAATGTADVVQLLLAKGAQVDASDSTGATPLIAALTVDDRQTVQLLLAAGTDVHRVARTGTSATPLITAAYRGNVDAIKTLLARKVDVRITSADDNGRVKNGLIQFGRVTALHAAVSSGDLGAVRLLLDGGADPNARDVRGMTPLVWAVSTDRPNARIVRLLLDKRASPAIKTDAGEDATDWARKFNNPAVLAVLGTTPQKPPAEMSPASGPAVSVSPREAVARSLPLLDLASGRVTSDGGCVACHAQPLSAMSNGLARARGWSVAGANRDGRQLQAFIGTITQPMLQMRGGGGQPDGQLYLSMAMAAVEMPPSFMTDALAHFLAGKQRADGSWNGTGATRAPMQDGDFSRTALGIRALTAYPIPSRAPEFRERVARAASWLASRSPLTTEDRVMQLLGLHWAHSNAGVRESRGRELQASQRSDGGWGQTPFLPSDAYATGQVVYALRELGLPTAAPSLQRGVSFLTRTQQSDGSWHVKSRAMKIQPYFESSFPHSHDQWISQAGTSWATMALAATAPR